MNVGEYTPIGYTGIRISQFSGNLTQQTHNVNTTLYNVVILQRCENYIPATLLQHKLQRFATMCIQRCEITLKQRCENDVVKMTLLQRCDCYIKLPPGGTTV